MAIFIVTRPRITWETYIVEAPSKEQAQQGDGEYIGVTDADYFGDAVPVVTGPFETKEEARENDAASVEYH